MDKIVVDWFSDKAGEAKPVAESEALRKREKGLGGKRCSGRLKVILVGSRIEEKGGSGYDGMNWYAAKWLNRKRHTVDFPYSKDTIIVNRQLCREDIAWVKRHERIEVDIMRKNPKMSYLEAHARTLVLQGFTSEDDLSGEVVPVQELVKALAKIE